MRKQVFLFLFLGWALALSATDITSSYYSSLSGKSDSTLRAALTELLYTHHTIFIKYNWDFPYDYDEDGNMLDIYSDCGFNIHNTYTSDYKCCCDAINREHVVCQSNFGGSDNKDKVPQYSDRHHLYPVDGSANGHRSDLPFGECAGGEHRSCKTASTVYPDEGTSTCALHEYGKSGTPTFRADLLNGGSVYEVGDEYKGDIARAILYMVVRYADKAHCRLPDGAKNATTTLKTENNYPVTAWANTTKDKVGQMFSASLSINHGLSAYGKALLLKWHRQDPVSQKEIDRNNGIDTLQGNRNPFVDYPYLVEYLWGSKTSEAFDFKDVVGSFEESFIVGVSDGSSVETPTISVNATSITMDVVTAVNGTSTKTFTLLGSNLTEQVSIAIKGSQYITVSPTTISAEDAASGQTITITYHPAETGIHTDTLTLTSNGATSKTVEISGMCCIPYTLTLVRNGALENVTCCGAFDLPAASTEEDACDGWIFKGWSTESSYNNTMEPSFVTSVTAADTLYAIYAHKVGTGASTNEYTLYSGALTEGDYVIYYNDRAMKARVASNRMTFDAVTPVNDTISSTNDSLIWHIAQSGEYWTIYNARVGKYAAANGTANQIQLIVSGTDDKSLWTASGTATYDFVNLYNTTKEVNANLRNNGSYGFSCYGTSTGKALSLYKRGSAVVTYKTVPCVMHTIALADEEGLAYGGQYAVSATRAIEETEITVDVEPDDGYELDSIWVTQADDPTVRVAVSDGKFTMPAFDVAVSCAFKIIPTYTATWKANGGKHASQAGLYAGEMPTMPSKPSACSEERGFIGWTENGDYSNEKDAPSDLFTADAPAIDENATFYAVYADGEQLDTTIVLASYDTIRGQFGSYKFDALKNNGSTPPAYNATAKDGRIYAKGTLSIRSAHTMDSIVIYLSTQGKKRLAPITANVGAIKTQASGDATVIWTGSADSVAFTVGEKADYGSDGSSKAGQLCFDSVLIHKNAYTTYSNYSLYCGKETRTMTFMANGASHAERTSFVGAVVEPVAAPAAGYGYSFVGWSSQQYDAQNNTVPNLDYSGHMPDDDATFYAVYSNADTVTMSNEYKRITTRNEFLNGNYVLTGYASAQYRALSTVPKDNYYFAGIAVTPNSEDIVSNPGDSIIWRITVSDGLAALHNAVKGDFYIEENSGHYNIKVGDNSIGNKFTYRVNDGNWQFWSETYPSMVLEYFIAKSRWAFYTSPDAPVYLFKQQPSFTSALIYTTSPIIGAPTSLADAEANISAVKVLREGHLLILRGDGVYTMQGQKVK